MTIKRHVVTTVKILAVTLTSAGCSRAPAPDARAEPAPDATASAAAKPNAEDPKVLELRDELDRLEPTQAAKEAPRFRALCDADGYPLVGNVMRKGPSGMQPSALCSLLRGKK